MLNSATSAMVTQHDEKRWHKLASSANMLWTLMFASILFNFVVGLLNHPVDTELLLMLMYYTSGSQITVKNGTTLNAKTGLID